MMARLAFVFAPIRGAGLVHGSIRTSSLARFVGHDIYARALVAAKSGLATRALAREAEGRR